jgi:hypothetical protein
MVLLSFFETSFLVVFNLSRILLQTRRESCWRVLDRRDAGLGLLNHARSGRSFHHSIPRSARLTAAATAFVVIAPTPRFFLSPSSHCVFQSHKKKKKEAARRINGTDQPNQPPPVNPNPIRTWIPARNS